MFKVAVIVGSLRRDSINRQLARALGKLAAPKLQFTEVEIADLPVYNDDLWATPPAAVTRLKQALDAADAVLIATPEYNRSIPAAVKNVLDWGSRPWGQSSWAGKPVAVIGATPGNIGTGIAQQHLRTILAHLDALVMGQPEGFIVFKDGLVDARHDVTVPSTKEFLQSYVDRFTAWIERLAQREPTRLAS